MYIEKDIVKRILSGVCPELEFYEFHNQLTIIDFADQSSEVFTICDEGSAPENGSLATMLGTISEGVKNRNIFFSKPEAPKINAIAEEQRSFIDAITNGSPIEVSARDAADALMIAELISDIISRNGLK